VQASFGIEEGGALVAVERANGGELAPLPQVLRTLNSFTPSGSRPVAASFANSVRLLIDFGVVEYIDSQLGLTPEGRKLLRRSGMPNDSRHVALVTGLLQEFDEYELEPEESVIAPTEQDVQEALGDADRVQQTDGGLGTPLIGEEAPTYSTILPLGTPGFVFGTHWVPAEAPEEADSPEPPESNELTVSPAHPFLDRLFGRGHQDRNGPADSGGR